MHHSLPSHPSRRDPSDPAVLVTCRSCGQLRIDPERVTVTRHRGDASTTSAFRCGWCDLVHVHPVDPATAARLLAAGSSLVEAGDAPAAGPITEDEVRRFGAALDGDDWFELLAGR